MCDECFAPWEMGISGLAPDVPPEVVEDAELWPGGVSLGFIYLIYF